MKTIGLVGGTGWASTVEYYRIINKEINNRLDGNNFAKCILYSFNFGDVFELIKKDDMEGIYEMTLDAVIKLEKAGSDCILLCANTMHLFADKIKENISVPLIHIAEAAAREIKKKNLKKVGLLGTKITMEKDFYKSVLIKNNIDVLVPDLQVRDFIQKKITDEMVKDIFDSNTKNSFLKIIDDLMKKGADGIVLGCTEIPLLIKPEDVSVPVVDTLYCHSIAAVDFVLNEL